MKSCVIALLLSSIIVVPSLSHATTWNVPSQCPTIQAGIDSASAGDTVLVACDTYYEYNIVMKSGITLKSQTGQPDCVTLDAQENSVRIMTCVDVDNTTTIKGLTFTGANATYAGGIYCERSSPVVDSCAFVDNQADYGGGLYCSDSSSPTVTNCSFSDNQGIDGAGLYCTGQSSPALTSCTFFGNSASTCGGGVFSYESTPEFSYCVFDSNSATAEGGGFCCDHNSSATLTSCVFTRNATGAAGGGLYCRDGSFASAVGCTFSRNQGSGVYMAGTCPSAIQECTISHNVSSQGAGFCQNSGTSTIDNTIIAFNGPGEGVYSAGGTITATCCDIYGNLDGDWDDPRIQGQLGTNGNFSADPAFCDTANADYHLRPCSPCIDAPGCGQIGALGLGDCARVWHVPADAPTIQAGIDSASACDTVLVACGTYYERDIVMKSGITLLSEWGTADCCTVSARDTSRVFYCENVDSTASITGFTVTGGDAEGVSPCPYGGGIYCTSASPTIENCHITGNQASDGGGIFCDESDPTLADCILSHNSAQNDGGGLDCYKSSPSVAFCAFFNNSAGTHGGGISCADSCYPQITNCTFVRNSSSEGVIASRGAGSSPTLENVIVAFDLLGEAVYCDGSNDVTLTCCDVYGNAGGNWTGCIADSETVNNNFEADPCFCDTANDDYRLRFCSPCIDAPGCGLIGALGVGSAPTAAFMPTDTVLCGGGEICFTNLSQPDTAECVWIFCGVDTVTERYPCYVFPGPGPDTCEMILVAFGTCGNDTAYGQVTIYPGPAPTAAFSSTVARGVFGCDSLEVCFSDESAGVVTDRLWVFGDGVFDSTNASPCHTYSTGYYDVTLIVGNPCGYDTLTKTNHVLVYDSPEAGFYADSDSVCIDQTVCFHDTSSGEYTERYWDFGDGADTTGVSDPCHVYDSDGLKTVALVIDGVFCGADTTTRQVMVCAPPVAGIYAEPHQGLAPLTVDFSDQSLGCVSSREWDFGDGTLPDTTPNPQHTFEIPGTYDVTLRVDGLCGTDVDTLQIEATATGMLCFEPDVIDTTHTCCGDTVHVSITLDGNVYPVGEIGFDVTFESPYFTFSGECINGDLTSGWPPIGCSTIRGEDSVRVYGTRSGTPAIPADASGTLAKLIFNANCPGMAWGDSMPTLKCITKMAYDCSTFVACQCREWTVTGVADITLEPPRELALSEPYPNPFNPGTTIEYDLPSPGGRVTLAVFDVRGRLVRTLIDEAIEAGHHKAYWDGADDAGGVVPSGIYFYRLTTPQGVEQRKAVVLK